MSSSGSSTKNSNVYTILSNTSTESINPFPYSSLSSTNSFTNHTSSTSPSSTSSISRSGGLWSRSLPNKSQYSKENNDSSTILSFATSSSIPLVPSILQGMDFPEHKDPLSFTEICPVRGVGAAVMGGLFGFFLGGFFSGYGQLAPYDPALKDWQQTNLAKTNAVSTSVTSNTPTPAPTTNAPPLALPSSSTSSSVVHTVSTTTTSTPPRIQPYSPVHLPEIQITSPITKLNPLSSSSLASSARSIIPSSMSSTTIAPSTAISISPNTLSTVPLPGSLPFPTDPTNVPLRVAFVQGMKEMGTRAVSSGKNFALVGAVYSTIECFLEKARGKRDLPNALISGFSTGAILAARAGPSAMVMGGAGFAAFSGAIEILSPYIFDH